MFILLSLFISFAPLVLADTPVRIRALVPLESSAAFDQAIADSVRQFNSNQAQYRVELMRASGTFQGLRTIIASHYARDLPDLALVNEADLPTLQLLGVLQPLPEKWVAGKKFLPRLLSETKCRGSTCSVPFQRRVAVWYFNRELLFKFNLETEKISTSWTNLSALSRRLPAPLSGLGIPVTGEFTISRWTAMGLNLGTSPALNTAEWVQKMWAAKSNWLPGAPSVDEAKTRFIEQKTGFLLGSLEQYPYLKTNVSFKLGAALPEGELSWFGTDFVITTAAPAQAAGAREFLDFLYQPETSLNFMRTAGSLPVSQNYLGHASWKKELEQWPLVKTAVARKLKPSYLGKIPPQVRDEWADVVWQAVENEVPVAERRTKALELKAVLEKLLSSNPR